MRAETVVARALASAFLAGEWSRDGLAAAGAVAMGARRRWLGPLARDVLAVYRRPPHDRPRELAEVVESLPVFRRAAEEACRRGRRLHAVRWVPAPTRMVRGRWPVPAMDGVDDVAALLGVDAARLAWLADTGHHQRRTPPGLLHLYRYRWVARPSRLPRLLEAPRTGLLRPQRTLLAQVLAGVPAHPAAHGFVPGRGVRTAVAAHTGAEVLIRLDLRSFFASVRAGRVYGGTDLRRRADRVVAGITRIAAEEGFELNRAKTRVRTRSQRQQVLGVVVNERASVPRDEYDRLRAVLFNAARTGLEAQNRDGHPDFAAHLAGKVAWVASIDPVRGAALRARLAPLVPPRP